MVWIALAIQIIIYFPNLLMLRSLAVIDPSGRWLGETDGGEGSPTIRYQGCGGSGNP